MHGEDVRRQRGWVGAASDDGPRDAAKGANRAVAQAPTPHHYELTTPSVPFFWTPQRQAGFAAITNALVSAPAPRGPDWSKLFYLSPTPRTLQSEASSCKTPTRQLPTVELACNNSINSTAGFSPLEILYRFSSNVPVLQWSRFVRSEGPFEPTVKWQWKW